MDPINIQYSLNVLSSENSALPQSGADQAATEQFQQALNHGQSTFSNQSGDSASPVLGAAGTDGTLGDRILQGLQHMKSGYDTQVGAVQDSLRSSDPLSINDMMKLQLDLAKLSLQGELINKTVSKSTQNLDTLLKSQ